MLLLMETYSIVFKEYHSQTKSQNIFTNLKFHEYNFDLKRYVYKCFGKLDNFLFAILVLIIQFGYDFPLNLQLKTANVESQKYGRPTMWLLLLVKENFWRMSLKPNEQQVIYFSCICSKRHSFHLHFNPYLLFVDGWEFELQAFQVDKNKNQVSSKFLQVAFITNIETMLECYISLYELKNSSLQEMFLHPSSQLEEEDEIQSNEASNFKVCEEFIKFRLRFQSKNANFPVFQLWKGADFKQNLWKMCHIPFWWFKNFIGEWRCWYWKNRAHSW